MFLRWVAGLVLILVCGWGLIFGCVVLASRLGWHMETGLAVLGALLSLGLLYLLETNLWLSRFMGLRLGERSAQWKESLFFWVTGVPGLLFRSTEAPVSAVQTKPAAGSSSTREVVETVVFVVVLVLLLKTFAAEAFVIPTGSMATTLWGYQKSVKCPRCGYWFPVNCSEEVEGTGEEGSGGRHRTATESAICPNCWEEIDFRRDNVNPPCATGDRVLVAKSLYDIGLAQPRPGDVVVFKYPEKPQTDYTPMNYIKRLIGVPGRTIGIYYGKLYLWDNSQPPQWEDDLKDLKPPTLEVEPGEANEGAARSWGPAYEHYMQRLMHVGDEGVIEQLRTGKNFKIFRRPLHWVLAERRIVYDNDHPPSDFLDQDYQRWRGAASTRWASANDHGFHHDAEGGDKIDMLHYRHVLRYSPRDTDGHPRPELITDIMGYNTRNLMTPGLNWVGDLSLDCDVTVDQPKGTFVLELSRGVNRFRASWDLATGVCTLQRAEGTAGREYQVNPDDDKAFQPIGQPQGTSLGQKGTHHLRFANVDERLIVWVDNQLPFGDGVEYPAPRVRGPYANDLQPASIGVRQAGVSVHHIVLWRDTYYTQSPGKADAAELNRPVTDPDLHQLLADPSRWENLRKLGAEIFHVQPDYYFCLGDNSPASSDSRVWGLVPKRLMLGRALLVYYPFKTPWNQENRVGPIK